MVHRHAWRQEAEMRGGKKQTCGAPRNRHAWWATLMANRNVGWGLLVVLNGELREIETLTNRCVDSSKGGIEKTRTDGANMYVLRRSHAVACDGPVGQSLSLVQQIGYQKGDSLRSGRQAWSGRCLAVAAWLLMGFITLGCSETPQIEKYRAPKDPPLPVASRQATETQPAQRILAAIIPREPDVWFLRATVDPSIAREDVDDIQTIAKNIQFDNDSTPHWTLPPNWQELPGDSIRYRTLRKIRGETNPPLDVAVTRLPMTGGDWNAYLLANVNRWRGQIGLEPLSAEELPQQVVQLTGSGGQVVFWCDFQRAVDRAASADSPAQAPPAERSDVTAPGQLQLGYVPADWRRLPEQALRQAAFAVGEGNQQGEVTVIALGPQSGSLEANVNRWRGQIGLPEATAQEIAASRRTLAVGQSEADYFVLEPESDQGEAILGVILRRPDRVWFIKFRGPVTLVKQQQAAFERFVTELRVP